MKKRNIITAVVTIIISLPVFCFGWLFYGPFETARKYWICTAMSTASHKYLATAFFPDSVIDKYTDANFNTLEKVPKQDENRVKVEKKSDKITVEDVSVGLSSGKIMIIENPALVDISVCDYIGTSGLPLKNLIIQENAVGGINAGAYIEKEGSAHGSMPGGVIIKDGEIIYSEEFEKEEDGFCLIGFDNGNILKIGYVKTEAEVKAYKLRCGVSFGPPLIINGEPLIKAPGASLQPRTAIAQREDGAVLFLVLDGRQASSAGATLKNVQDLLLEYGAVNAANLDGGSSTSMEYNGKLINKPSDNGDEKRIPSAFVVKQGDSR